MNEENIVGYWTKEIPERHGFYLCECGDDGEKTYHILFIGDGKYTMNGHTRPIREGDKPLRQFTRFADIGAAKL